MKNNDDFIASIDALLPDQCTPEDLVSAGIFLTKRQVLNAVRDGKAPDYFVLPARGFIFLRESVVEYLQQCSQSGSEKQKKRVRNARK